MTTEKKKVPREPEPFIISDEEDDNLFFALSPEEDMTELSLVVDVKGDGRDDNMEYLHSIFLDIDYIKELIKWLKETLKYNKYVEEHGPVMPIIMELQDID